LIVGDLLDSRALGNALKEVQPEAVLHFAASASVAESMGAPEKYFRNNVVSGIQLLDAMIESGVKRLIFSSSCATYGLAPPVPIDESMPQVPINPYGESKLMFERMLPWYEQAHGITSIGLRFFNVAGASRVHGEDHRVETHLIPSLLKVVLGQRSEATIYGRDYETGDGTCVRDYVYVMDVAAAHLAALSARQSGFFNLGNERGYSVGEVIEMCRKVTGHRIPVVVQSRRSGDPASLVASASRIQKTLGWRPRYSALKSLVESAWEWHRLHPNGYETG
jgi:UDP-glucose 4-epimerase